MTSRTAEENPSPPDTGRADVNRPFSAFGVLLGLLAATMFAVSSTSRSTTIKPAWERASRAAVRRPVGYPHLDVATATAGREGDEDGLCSPGAIEAQLNDEPSVNTVSATENQGFGQESRTILMPVLIEAATDTGAFPVPEPMDERSGYDPVYDYVVLGEVRHPEAEVREEGVRDLSDTEITTLFQSILAVDEPSLRPSREKSAGRSQTSPFAKSILHALQNWLAHRVDLTTPTATESVEWNDYVEMMDSGRLGQVVSTEITGISGGE